MGGVIKETASDSTPFWPPRVVLSKPENASIGRILRDNGYATSGFGEAHNIRTSQYSAPGPFDQWPVGLGFEHFYGFLAGRDGPSGRLSLPQHKPRLSHELASPATTSPLISRTTRFITCHHMRELNASTPASI